MKQVASSGSGQLRGAWDEDIKRKMSVQISRFRGEDAGAQIEAARGRARVEEVCESETRQSARDRSKAGDDSILPFLCLGRLKYTSQPGTSTISSWRSFLCILVSCMTTMSASSVSNMA